METTGTDFAVNVGYTLEGKLEGYREGFVCLRIEDLEPIDTFEEAKAAKDSTLAICLDSKGHLVGKGTLPEVLVRLRTVFSLS